MNFNFMKMLFNLHSSSFKNEMKLNLLPRALPKKRLAGTYLNILR